MRALLAAGIAAGYAAAVLANDDPAPYAIGLAPIALLALEACWRLFGKSD
jgi:hypothetical protein